MKIDLKSFKFGDGVTSMTGFGRSEKDFPEYRISVELRTVNNRFCDIAPKIPRELNPIESDIREKIRAHLHRGRINLFISLDRGSSNDQLLQIDTEAAKACYTKLQDLNKAIGGPDTVTVGQLLHFSDLFTITADHEVTEELKQRVFDTLGEAIQNLIAMRRDEGQALAKDLLQRIEQIEKARLEVVELSQDQPALQMEKIRERLSQLLSEPLDPGRLEQEMAILADRLDITEECVRLESHCQRFLETMQGDEAAGKRLGFLVQEMNREANTISSKAATADLSHLAVKIKEEIERIREQIQNLE